VQASCEYEGLKHRRRVQLTVGKLLVTDEIEGPPGDHVVEQIWQLGPAASKVRFTFSAPAAEVVSRFSPAYGVQRPGCSRIARIEGPLPVRLTMQLEPIE
jgi:hypothetical protein